MAEGLRFVGRSHPAVPECIHLAISMGSDATTTLGVRVTAAVRLRSWPSLLFSSKLPARAAEHC